MDMALLSCAPGGMSMDMALLSCAPGENQHNSVEAAADGRNTKKPMRAGGLHRLGGWGRHGAVGDVADGGARYPTLPRRPGVSDGGGNDDGGDFFLVLVGIADHDFVELAETGTGGDEVAADDVLLHALEVVRLAGDGGFVEDLGGFLERGG